MSEKSSISLANLQAEINKLNFEILKYKRELRELEIEISNYVQREKLLLEEIEFLEKSLNEVGISRKTVIQAESVSDLLLPKLNLGTGLDRSGKGLECVWSDFVGLFTDKIFLEKDEPDTILYRDEEEKCYRTPNGHTKFLWPVYEEDLKRIGVIHFRQLSDSEIKEIEKLYSL